MRDCMELRKWRKRFSRRSDVWCLNISMGEGSQLKANWKIALLPFFSASSIAYMLVAYCHLRRGLLSYQSVFWLAELLSPFALLVAAVILLRNLRVGYKITMVGAVLALPWIFMTESRSFSNSWIALNVPGNDPVQMSYAHYASFRILSVALLLVTLLWASIRSFPPSWRLLRCSVHYQTWPAVAVALSVIAYWFVSFAVPYRQPMIVDAAQPELNILHVEKNVTSFRETRVSVYQNGECYVAKSERNLFRYSFAVLAHEAVLNDDLRAKSMTLEVLPQLKRTVTAPPPPLRSLRAEGWYVQVYGSGIADFTTENRASPPAGTVDLFAKLAVAPSTNGDLRYEMRDVCLGFCYDPKAALGYTAANQRCVDGLDGKEHCD